MTRKVRYTTAEAIGRDAVAWMSAIAPYLRHQGLGPLDRAALLVLDLQRYFLDAGAPAFLPTGPAVIPAVRTLIHAFRDAGQPVVFTRHADPDGEGGCTMEEWWGRRLNGEAPWADLSPEITVLPRDRVLVKTTYSAFQGTGLADVLARLGVHSLVLCGLQTHLCVETTARHAFTLGLRPLVVADATAAPDLDLHLGALRGLGHGVARIVLSSEVVAAITGQGICHLEGRDLEPLQTMPVHAPLDLLVIGAGPAGLAAATQAVRMGLRTLVVERDRPGGLLRAALLVENYPGFPGGIRGLDLSLRIEAQARATGVEVVLGEVLSVQQDRSQWMAILSDGRRIDARTVLVATGTRPRRLGVPGEADLAGRFLFYRVDEVPHDLVPGTVLVVGGGDCALDQALYLWQMGWCVEVLVRGPRPKALPLLIERATERGVLVHTGTVIVSADGRDGKVTVLTLGPDGEQERRGDLVLVSVGREPCLPVVPKEVVLGEVDSLGRTVSPGLYLAGDCRRGLIRQTAVAVGDGVAVAMDVARYLEDGIWR